jgi:hypothetical protein
MFALSEYQELRNAPSNNSREAAQACSPRRKPEDMFAPLRGYLYLPNHHKLDVTALT